jgi:F-type H+-transporting ATPase subunit b
VDAILRQLELDYTFWVQFIIFAVVFVILGNVYFKPFLKLFEARHKRTVEDRQAAEKMMAEAQAKFEEYKQQISLERTKTRKEYETLLDQAKREETELLAQARGEAKKITQEASDSISQQRAELKRQLESDVESLAKQISETLLLRRD